MPKIHTPRIVESSTPPEDTKALWIDITEDNDKKVKSIKRFNNGKWEEAIDYPRLPETQLTENQIKLMIKQLCESSGINTKILYFPWNSYQKGSFPVDSIEMINTDDDYEEGGFTAKIDLYYSEILTNLLDSSFAGILYYDVNSRTFNLKSLILSTYMYHDESIYQNSDIYIISLIGRDNMVVDNSRIEDSENRGVLVDIDNINI